MDLTTGISTGLGRKRGCWRPVLTRHLLPTCSLSGDCQLLKNTVWVTPAVLVATDDPLTGDSVPGGVCSWMWWGLGGCMAELKQWMFPSPSYHSSIVVSTAPCWTPWRPQWEVPQPPCGTELNSGQRKREWSYMGAVTVLSAHGSSLLLTFLCQRKACECVWTVCAMRVFALNSVCYVCVHSTMKCYMCICIQQCVLHECVYTQQCTT